MTMAPERPTDTRPSIEIGDVVIGEDRLRDVNPQAVERLVMSIEQTGLLHPIVVDENNRLIDGRQRIAALASLGESRIPVTVITVVDPERAEFDANDVRQGWTLAEKVEFGRRIEVRLKAIADERIAYGRRFGRPGRPQQLDEESSPSFQEVTGHRTVREATAAAVGVAGSTYDRARSVFVAAEAEPEKYADLRERIETTNKATSAYEELKYRQEREARAAAEAERIAKGEPPPPEPKKPKPAPRPEHLRGRRRPDIFRFMEQNLLDLESVANARQLMRDVGLEAELAHVDPTQVAAWVESMGESLRQITRFHRELQKDMTR